MPIASFDHMEYVFQDKHARGEFLVLQTPYDHVSSRDKDFVGDKNVSDVDVDPTTQYDSDCLPDDTNSESSSSKRPRGGSLDKGKRDKCDDNVVTDVTYSLRDISETMRFTHVTNPNENLYKIIDYMEEYPLYILLVLHTSMATNEQVASMLKERPMHSIKEWVRRWVTDNYSSYVPTNM
ncbi:hypothetical protein BRADI_3g33992v3 [Brachypodium distachyon]|uniref:Uncharacterized protein n=1 Tax=Brachypodium distachyon TaxID=15368 RepID=A0A0Q3FIL9_BRADI|nr:hypothetical protein BRADI_3g33992v3 [Brachypodium distachyon]